MNRARQNHGGRQHPSSPELTELQSNVPMEKWSKGGLGMVNAFWPHNFERTQSPCRGFTGALWVHGRSWGC